MLKSKIKRYQSEMDIKIKMSTISDIGTEMKMYGIPELITLSYNILVNTPIALSGTIKKIGHTIWVVYKPSHTLTSLSRR